MKKWLNTAYLGQQELHEGAASSWGPSDIAGLITSIQTWTENWLGQQERQIVLVDSTTAACDEALMALGADVDAIICTSLAHPTVIHSVEAAARRLASISGRRIDAIVTPCSDLLHVDFTQQPECFVGLLEEFSRYRCAIVVIEHVTYLEGLLLNVAGISAAVKSRFPGWRTLIDGAQAIGIWPTDPGEFDAYIGCFHKVIAAPPASAVLSVANQFSGGLSSHVAAMCDLPRSLDKLPTLDLQKWQRVRETLSRHGGREETGRLRRVVAEFNRAFDAHIPKRFRLVDTQGASATRSHINSIKLSSDDVTQRVREALIEAGFHVQMFGPFLRFSSSLDADPEWCLEIRDVLLDVSH